MTIYAEKRKGKPTGILIVEVQRAKKIIRQRTTDIGKARIIEAHLRAGLEMPKDAPNEAYTIGQFRKDARVVWKGTKTESQSIRRFHRVCDIVGDHMLLKSVRTTSLDRVVAKLRMDGLSDASINRYLSTFSSALKWAKARDHIDDKPALPWGREGEGRIVVLSEEDEFRLYEYLHKRGRYTHALVFRVLVVTGMRVGELLTLEPRQVLDGLIKLDDPSKLKGGRPRDVPILPDLCEPLRLALTDCQLPSYRALLKAFGKARKALGLDPKLTLHGLRHTFASRSDAKGMTPFQIQKVLGHTKIETTLRYVHSLDDALKDSYLRAWSSPTTPRKASPIGISAPSGDGLTL